MSRKLPMSKRMDRGGRSEFGNGGIGAHLIRTAVLSTLAILCVPSLAYSAGSQVTAIRAASSPEIDGNLDERAWERAAWFDDFVQKTPVNDAAPSRRTAFAVLFDDRFLYFGVRCEVEQPDEIVTRLVRRDREAEFDTVEFTVSPRGDKRTGYGFSVNPDGVKRDSNWSSDTVEDPSWDAVWHAETAVSDTEWRAEIAIPLDQLRFAGGETFGLQVERWISDLQELVLFNPVPDRQGGTISAAGRLVGTADIAPRLPRVFIPESYLSYTASHGGYTSVHRDGLFFGGGGYAKVGLSSDVIADFAVLPDFGQVEVDEVVLNLTAYETLFPEKRPFFLEGAGLFTTPIQLFYSRRFGQPPAAPSLDSNEEVAAGVPVTPILGAIKLTGRTDKGLSYGVIDSVFLPTEFLVADTETGNRTLRAGSPWTNGAALRLVSEVGDGGAVGFLGTALNPWGSAGSYAGGVDWRAVSSDRLYAWQGQAAGSARLEEIGGRTQADGGSIWTSIGRVSGEPIRYQATYQYASKGFDPNDLGYAKRDDLHDYAVTVNHSLYKGAGPLLKIYTSGGIDGEWNTDGVRLYHSAWFLQGFNWRNQWYTQYMVYGGIPYYDDREMRGGPPLRFSAFGGGTLFLRSPLGKPLGFSLTGEAASRTYGYRLSASATLSLRLGRVELELAPQVDRTLGDIGYVDTLNEDTEDEVFVAAERSLTKFNLSLKGTIVFMRDLTLQVQSQLLNVHVDYSNYSAVTADGRLVPTDYSDGTGSPLEADFARVDIVFQALLRWEFLPGSTAFLIYTYRGVGAVDDRTTDIGEALRDVRSGSGQQMFMLKVSRRFG